MDIDTLNGLKACLLFKGLTENEIIDLMHQVQYRVQEYEKDDVFALSGDPCRHANIMVSGEMSAKLIGPSGRVIRMDLHHSGQLLAPAFLFVNDGHYPVTIEAVRASRVLRIGVADMRSILQLEPRVALNLVAILSNNINFLTNKVSLLSMTVREKVGSYIKTEMKRQGTSSIMVTLSRQQLADEFGIQKYSLQRCLHELQEEGVIRIDGKHIDVDAPNLL
jgi:CRP-like cAMP-binding protein